MPVTETPVQQDQTHTETTKIVSEQELQALYFYRYCEREQNSLTLPANLPVGVIIDSYQEYRLEPFNSHTAANARLNTIAAEGYTIKQVFPGGSDGKGVNVLFARFIARIKAEDPKPEPQPEPQEGVPNA